MGKRLRTALDWLRGFLEGMMGAQSYDEAAFRRQVRDLLADGTAPAASESAGKGDQSNPPFEGEGR